MSNQNHITCGLNSVYKSVDMNYTYSQFSLDSGKNDATLSTVTSYTASKYNEAMKKAANYALYSICVSYTGGIYHCPGNRQAAEVVGSRNLTYAQDYNTGDVLSSPQPDLIRQNLMLELSQRKRHALYKQQQQYNKGPYVAGTVVHHDQPTSMSQHLGNLNNFISSTTNVAPKLNNGHGDYKHKGEVYGFTSPSAYRSNQHMNQSMNVQQGDSTIPNDLKPIQPNISVDYNDCICYSDCITHGKLRVKYCTCNINCICNYS